MIPVMYTDLDSLYDTKFELLKSINPNLAYDLLHSGRYHIRNTENFGPITSDMFYPLWSKRTKKLFLVSRPTNLMLLINDFYKDMYNMEELGDMLLKFKLIINIAPYKLTKEEYKLLELKYAEMLPNCRVECVDIPVEELSTKWVVANVGAMFVYDFIKWCNYRLSLGDFETSINRVFGITPYTNMHSPLISNVNSEHNKDGDFITVAEDQFKPFLRVRFAPMFYYCVTMKVTPEQLEEYRRQNKKEKEEK